MFGSYSTVLTSLDRISPVTFNSLHDQLRLSIGAAVCKITSENKLEPGEEIITEYFVVKQSQLLNKDLVATSSKIKTAEVKEVDRAGQIISAQSEIKKDHRVEISISSQHTAETADERKSEDSFVLVEKVEKEFYVFQVAIDQEEDVTTGPFRLPSITGLVRRFHKEKPESEATLLIPLYQCGGYFGTDPKAYPFLQRHHIVLAEIDLASWTYRVHDSQNRICSLPYFNKFVVRELGFVEANASYCHYGTQKDRFSCGYNVFEYIISMLYSGNASDFGKMVVDPTLIKNRQYFLDNWRKVTERIIPGIVSAKHIEEDDICLVDVVGIPGMSAVAIS